MQNQDNQRKIYIRNTKQWVPVTEEVYSEYYRPIWRLQKEAQKNGQCVCPKFKLWVCDGDCATCEYHAAGNTVSLDAPMENAAGEEFCLLDTLEDKDSSFADVLVDRLLLEQLLDELSERDPEGKRICELIMEGSSKTEIADTLQREFGGDWYKSKAVYREKQMTTAFLTSKGFRFPAFFALLKEADSIRTESIKNFSDSSLRHCIRKDAGTISKIRLFLSAQHCANTSPASIV